MTDFAKHLTIFSTWSCNLCTFEHGNSFYSEAEAVEHVRLMHDSTNERLIEDATSGRKWLFRRFASREEALAYSRAANVALDRGGRDRARVEVPPHGWCFVGKAEDYEDPIDVLPPEAALARTEGFVARARKTLESNQAELDRERELLEGFLRSVLEEGGR